MDSYVNEFADKKVVITGTSRGIGFALTEYFAKQKSIVYAVSRENIKYSCKNIIPIIGDINNYTEVVRQIENKAKDIDILINNAGIIYYKSLLDSKIEEIQQVFSTNVVSTTMFTNLIVKMMINNRTKGVIINTLSFAATIPSAGSGIYAASKAALVSLTKTMAAEFAPYGIRVNGYSPGVIETEMTEDVLKKNRNNMTNTIALHRIGRKEDIIGAVAFLASNDSAYITGINLDVSGGKFIVQNADKEWENEDGN